MTTPQGAAHVDRNRTAVQPSTVSGREGVAEGGDVKTGECRDWTDTAKGEDRTCEEKSEIELNA